MSKGYQEILRQARSSRIKYVYSALVEIRKTYIKSDKGVETLVAGGLVERLIQLLKTWENMEEAYQLKVLDICASILGNMCMLEVARKQVIKTHGINVIAQLLLTSDCQSIQNRCCRCLANILLSPSSWKLVHESSIIERITKLLKDSDNDECKQTYIRAIRLLGQTSKHVQDLLEEKCVSIVAKLLSNEKENVSQSVLRCLLSMSTHCCNLEFAAQIVTSGKLEYLLTACTEKNLEAFQLIVCLSNLPNFRPEFGNSNGITIFVDLYNSNEEFYTGLRRDVVDVLSLCCKEAVNRVKIRDSGSLQLLLHTLSDREYSVLHGRVISALVCFLYDQSSFDVLLENGLVDVLIKQLNDYMKLSDAGNSLNRDVESENQVESIAVEECSTKTTNNVAEECMGQNGELQGDMEDNQMELVENKDKLTVCKVNLQQDLSVEGSELNSETDNGGEIIHQDKSEIESGVKITEATLQVDSPDPKQRPVYSIDSPTYKPVITGDQDEYNSGAKCIERFTPPHKVDYNIPNKHYSPLSNSSYYSPSEGSPEYFQSRTSPNSKSVSSYGHSPQSRESSPQYVDKPMRNIYTGLTCSPDTSPDRCKSDSSSPLNPSHFEDNSHLSDVEREFGSSSTELTDDSGFGNTSHTNRSQHTVLQSTTADFVKGNHIGKLPLDDTETSSKDSEIEAREKPNEFRTKPNDKENDAERPDGMINDIITSRKRKKVSSKSIVFENNILILLSRISQTTDPSKHLVTMETITTLINYIRYMEAPLARAARLISRVFRNPLCFESLLRLNIPMFVFKNLLIEEDVGHLLMGILKNRNESFKRRHSSSKYTSSDEASDSDRFSAAPDSPTDQTVHLAKRQRRHSGETKHVHYYKGTFHTQEEAICDVGRCGVAFLEDLSEVAESSYGRGVVEKLLCEGGGAPQPELCIGLLFVTWSAPSREFFCKQLIVLDQVLSVLQDTQHRHSCLADTAIMGLSVVTQTMDAQSKYQSKTATSKHQIKKALMKGHLNVRNGSFKTSSVGPNENCGIKTSIKSSSCESDMCKSESLNCDVDGCLLANSSSHDLEFLINGEKLMANRTVLTKSSDIFTAMLEGHYSEANLSTITISNTSLDAFRYILHYLHGCTNGTCPVMTSVYFEELSCHTAIKCIDIITEADKYLLHSLKAEILTLLFERYVIPESAFPILKFSVLHGHEFLQKAAVSSVMVDNNSVIILIQFVNEILDSSYKDVFLQVLEDILTE